jgi:dihydrofolate reductase
MFVKICAIVAMSENGCIGANNELPWHVPEDLKRFKALTMGKPVIMGRKTMESIIARIGKPLPGRDNIVVSKSGFFAEGVTVCEEIDLAIDKAIDIAKETDCKEIFIIGGAQVYEQSMLYIDQIYLTKIHQDVLGDAYFPTLKPGTWMPVSTEKHEGNPSYSFITLVRG